MACQLTHSPLPDTGAEVIHADCLCGTCRLSDFCATPTGAFDCVVGSTGCLDAYFHCRNSGFRATAVPLVVTRDGTPLSQIYCLGDLAAVPDGGAMGPRSPSSVPDGCLWTIAGWDMQNAAAAGAWGLHPAEIAGQTFNDWAMSNCSTPNPALSCNVHGGLPDAGANLWASRINCPKPMEVSAPYVIVGSDLPDGAIDTDASLARGQNALGAICNTMSAADGGVNADLSATGPLGSGASPTAAYLCVARITSRATISLGAVSAPRGTGALDYDFNPPNLDPGLSPNGWALTATSGSLVITRDSDHGVVENTTNVTGTGAVAMNAWPDPYFVLSDLQLATTASGSGSNGDGGTSTFSSGSLTMSGYWVGLRSDSTHYSIAHANAPAALSVMQDDAPYNFVTNPSTDVSGTWITTGATPVLTVGSTFDDGTYTYTFAVTLTAAARPTATITTVTTVTPPAHYPLGQYGAPSVPIECTSPSGATFNPTGSFTPSGAAEEWSLLLPSSTESATGSSPTMTLPLYPINTPLPVITLNSFAGGLTGSDSRTVETVDSTAPVPGTPTFSFACGWGGTLAVPNGEPDTSKPSLCEVITLVAPDLCDPAPTFTLEGLRAYNSSGALVQSSTNLAGLTCMTAVPGYLDAALATLTYDLQWHATDHWGNTTGPRLTRYQVVRDGTVGSCLAARHATVLYNGPAEVKYADLTLNTPGAITLPSFLSLDRASSATVQSGYSTAILTGIGSNVARAGNDGVGHYGLLLEEARTNLVTNARGLTSSGWYAGSGVTTTNAYANGPDGTLHASRSVVSSGGYSNYQYLGAVTGYYTASAWVALGSGSSGSYQLFDEATTTTGAPAAGAASTAFNHVTATYNFPASSSSYLVPADGRNHTAVGGIAATALDTLSDLHQFEAGRFPTEVIVTSGGSATRAGERLYIASGSTEVTGGRFSLEVQLQPKGAWPEYPATIYLWHVDASNYATLNAASGVITVVIGGSSNTTNASPVWSRLDTLRIFVAAGGGLPTVAQMSVNGGTTWVGTITGSTLGTLSVTGAIDLLSNGTTNQFSSYVQDVNVWYEGATPGWTL